MDTVRVIPPRTLFVGSQSQRSVGDGLSAEDARKLSECQENLSVTSSEDTLYDWHQNDVHHYISGHHPFVAKDTNALPVDVLPALHETLDDEAIMQSFLDPSSIFGTQDNEKKRGRSIFSFLKRHPLPSPHVAPTPHSKHPQHLHQPLPTQNQHAAQRSITQLCRRGTSKHRKQQPLIAPSQVNPQTRSSQASCPDTVAPSLTAESAISPPIGNSSKLKSALLRLRSTRNESVRSVDTSHPPSSKSTLAEKVRNKFQKKHLSTSSTASTATLPRSLSVEGLPSVSSVSTASTASTASTVVTSHATGPIKHSLTPHSPPCRNTLQRQLQRHSMYECNKAWLPHQNTYDALMSCNSRQRRNNIGHSVQFSKVVSVQETYSRREYNRSSDPDAVCNRLSPALAYKIKDELNRFKLYEMRVHPHSRIHTHFFL